MSRKIRRAFRAANKKLAEKSKQVTHFQKVVEGFNFLVEKKAVVIEHGNVMLYRELIGSDRSKAQAMIKNAYIYMRMKKIIQAFDIVLFFDIESQEMIGQYDGENLILY